jgi:hypothetical protein
MSWPEAAMILYEIISMAPGKYLGGIIASDPSYA